MMAVGAFDHGGRQVAQVNCASPLACAVRAHAGAAGRFSLAFAASSRAWLPSQSTRTFMA
jgi:hypothetical protein